jgi:hypothetical protein
MCEKQEAGRLDKPAGTYEGMRTKSEFAGFNQASARQYTPLCVMMMLEMYVSPEKRSFYLYSTLPPAQAEILELLKRAQIVVPDRASDAQLWSVDEDALRTYVDAVCRVSLPTKVWVMR